MNDFEMTLISQDRINRLRAEADRSRLAAHGRDQQVGRLARPRRRPGSAVASSSPASSVDLPSDDEGDKSSDRTIATHRPASWDPYHRDP